MAKVFMPKIVEQVYKSKPDELIKQAQLRADAVFNGAVAEMKNDFESHLVTKEIDGGIKSDNISGTLGGGKAPRNLFSFIGFNRDTKPTDAIRERLDPSHAGGPKLNRKPFEEYRRGGLVIRLQFMVESPNEEAIYGATPIPWAPTMSWAEKMEDYIPGFAKFLPKFMGSPSESGGGIQLKGSVKDRAGDFQPPADKYLTNIFKRFLDRIKSGGR